MDTNWFYSLRKLAAEQVGQLRCSKIEKSILAVRFEIGRALSSKVNLDLRAAEWPQMIRCRGCSIGGAEEPAVFLEFFGVLKREEKLVGKAERQVLRSRRLVRKRGREKIFALCKYRGRNRDDDLVGLDCAIRRFNSQAPPVVIDPLHRAIELDRQ